MLNTAIAAYPFLSKQNHRAFLLITRDIYQSLAGCLPYSSPLKKDEEPVSYGEVWCARKDEKYQQGRPFAKFGMPSEMI